MSWHACAHLVKRDHSTDPFALLAALGHPNFEPAGSMDLDDALTPGDVVGCYFGLYDGWTIVFDYLGYTTGNGLDLIDGRFQIRPNASPLARLSQGTQAFSFFLEQFANIAAFTYYVDGVMIRSFYAEADTIKLDFGVPLSSEQSLFRDRPDYEESVLSMMKSLALTFQQMGEVSYEYYLPNTAR